MTGDQTVPKVVVGIIDDGIAFAHERFRSGDKTRVQSIWIQDGVFRGPPDSVAYGREVAKDEIDDLLRTCVQAGAVNEDLVYLRAGLFDYRRPGHKAATWRAAHGTHVMDLACGFDPAERRDDLPIVCVQLPARATANTSGADLTFYAADALLYIRDRADAIGREQRTGPLPIVVNFSYGIIGGPHDGTGALERIIDSLVAERRQIHDQPFVIVLPAGNSHLSRCHAEISFAVAGEAVRLHWRVLPDDKTPSFLDIWLPPRRAGDTRERVAATVTPPGGTESAPPLPDTRNTVLKWQPAGKTLCSLQFHEFAAPTQRGRFRITIRPTAAGDTPTPLAPAGTWTIALRNRAFAPGEAIQAWVHRDESLYGYPRRGRQSYFEHPDYVRFEAPSGREKETDDAGCPVKRARLLNAIATGKAPIVVGGFQRKGGRAAKYSAGGPTTAPAGAGQPNRTAPNVMAVSDDSALDNGVLAAGSRSGSVVAMNGTSVAAPQIAREIIARLARRQPADQAALAQLAAAQEQVRPPGSLPPPERAGAGRLELEPIVKLPRHEKATAGGA